mmetsp:Transcript_33603/g.46001  ORF Transcript_33603/g.46001 Transcript_33603/m.46001 type:complete len:1161 (+) Transcript_33603:1-3483(+)
MENVALLIIDVDEFVVSSQPLLHLIKEPDNCLSIERVHIYCSNCSRPDKLNILAPDSKWTKVIGDPKFEHPKLLVNPDKTECIYVHWSVCGQSCVQLGQETAFIFHFINYFQHRSHVLSPSNATNVVLSSEFLREFEKGNTKLPEKKTIRNLLSKDSITFHLIWTTGAEHFQSWRLFVLLSILRTHRNQSVVIHLYTNTLTQQFLSQLPDADKLNLSTIVFVPIDNELFRNTPLERWWSEHPEFSGVLFPSNDDHRYSHLTDLIRLVALWRYGGVYLDFDMMLLRSLDRFSNSFAGQKDLADKRITDSSDALNFAVAAFSRGHTFLTELMRMVPTVYNPNCWPCVGPKLITQIAEVWASNHKVLHPEHLPMKKMLDDNATINVFSHAWFYPFYWKRGLSLVQRKSYSMHDYRRVIHTAVTLHIWSHSSNFSVIQKGSVLDLLMHHFRLDLPVVGYGNAWDDITRQQHLSMSEGTVVFDAKSQSVDVLGSTSHRLLSSSFSITSESEEKNEGELQCYDFNSLATIAYRAGISADTVFTCPIVDTAGKTCLEKGRKIIKNVEDIEAQPLHSRDVLIFLTIGKRTDVSVLSWWLSLLNMEAVDQRVSSTVVLVAEGCYSGQERSAGNDSRASLSNCADNVVNIMRYIISSHRSIRFNLLRLNFNYRTTPMVKFQSITKAIFGKYPHMKFYIKMDEDAVLLPDRLHTFLNTLHAVTRSDVPISFGALRPTGTDGRIVYGMNNMAMNISANWNLYNANAQSLKAHISFVHCGGFYTLRGSRPSSWELRRSISYTQPQRPVATWLASVGKLLKEYYEDKNEWVAEYENDFKRHCVDFNDIGKMAVQNGHRSDDVYICPLVQKVVKGTCQERLRLDPPPKDPPAYSMKSEDVLVYIAVGRKHLKSEVPAIFWWLSLLDKENPSRRVTSEIVLIADSCKEDTTSGADYSQLYSGNCTDNATLLQQSLIATFTTVRFYLTRIHAIHRTNLALKFVYGAKSVYNSFPSKKYYFKVDDDTVVFPSRLASFLHTLEVGTAGGGMGNTPLYFGTIHDRLPYTIDWAQGGSGYGMNNKAMRLFAYSEPPIDHFGFGTSEDYNLWRALSKEAVQLIHCGGFFANTVNNTNDWHFRNTITFHRIKSNDWLKRYSEVLITNYYTNPTAKKEGFIDTF